MVYATVEALRDPRRSELAELLRARRRELRAEDVGLPLRTHRRTPGLRREEVAELAGISVALYAWLEQGRDVPVSHRTIDAIGAALRFSSDELAYVHTLLGRDVVVLREDVTPNLRRFVSALKAPAFVVNRRWDIVYRNAEAVAVFGGPSDLDSRSNLIEDVLTNAETAALFDDYEWVAAHLVSQFRLDWASRVDEAETQELVARLRSASPLFDAAWKQHEVRGHPEGVRKIAHREAGILTLEPTMYGVAQSPGLRILAFTALDAQTSARIASITPSPAFS